MPDISLAQARAEWEHASAPEFTELGAQPRYRELEQWAVKYADALLRRVDELDAECNSLEQARAHDQELAAASFDQLRLELELYKNPLDGAACIHRGQFIDHSGVCHWCRAEKAEALCNALTSQLAFEKYLGDSAEQDVAAMLPGYKELEAERDAAMAQVAALRKVAMDIDRLIQDTPPGEPLPNVDLRYGALRDAVSNTAAAAAVHDERVRREALESARSQCGLLLDGITAENYRNEHERFGARQAVSMCIEKIDAALPTTPETTHG